MPDARRGEQGYDDIPESLEVDTADMSPEDGDALDEDHVNFEVGFAYRAEPSGDSAQSKAKNVQYVSST